MDIGESPRPCRWIMLVALASSMPSQVCAEEAYDNYDKLIQTGASLSSPGAALFGEQHNLYSGSIEFVQTDVELTGNDQLDVRVGRRFVVGDVNSGHFKLWDLDIPQMHGVFGLPGGNQQPDGWAVEAAKGDAYKRCSLYRAPPTYENQGGFFAASEYWQGNFAYLPGRGDQEFLLAGSQAHRPNDARSYPIVLKDGGAIRCLSSLDGASESGAQGEGFELVDTEGTVYTFNHMVSRTYNALHKSDPAPGARTAAASTQSVGGGLIQPMVGVNYNLQRREYLIYPTKVTDRFGNSVSYQWNPSDPWQLLAIVASDGRRLELAYSSSDARLVTSVRAGSRVWNYGYGANTDTVTLPDGSAWQFDLVDFSRARVAYSGAPGCDNIRPWGRSAVGTIVAPTGARAEYAINSTLMGRSWVPRQCHIYEGYSETPYQYYGMALTSKTLSGPGLPAQGLTWSYDYGVPNSCWSSAESNRPADAVVCTAGSPTTRTVASISPDGTASRYVFGNRFRENEGLLLQTDLGWDGASALRTEIREYAPSDAAPYAAHNSGPVGSYGDNTVAAKPRPLRQVTTIESGHQLVWRVATDCGQTCFDEFARPTRVERFSPWHSRTDETTYYDDRTAWVLGQVASLRNLQTGIITMRVDYAANAKPATEWINGKVDAAYAYSADGTIASITDGRGNATSLSHWRRGIPQSVKHADGATKSSVVDEWGWIRQVTDENGFTTSYDYDMMGRLSSISYPANDDVAWNTTTQRFEQIGGDEYGIPAGHWRQTSATGNAVQVTYYDALWRKLLIREYDAGASGTLRASRFAYDHEGRNVFASYPGSSESVSTGVWTDYDALGRQTVVSQDSELGLLTTTTEYLPGIQTRVTNPRGAQTISGYQVFDEPKYDAPVWIHHAEGAQTTIDRDVFGKPVRIIRGAQ